MAWDMNQHEFASVISLPAGQRYSYSIKRIADWGEVWSLWSESGWVLSVDDDGHEIVPVWPHAKFAAACSSGEWDGATPRMLSLKDWLERWIPGMINNNQRVSVFPTPHMNGVVVTPERLKIDLEYEMTLFE